MIRARRRVAGVMLGLSLACAGRSEAAEWKYSLPEGATAVQAEICTFKYGKDWAYTVEIDDGTVTTLTVSQPLLAKYFYTDAPPGVSGGKALPLVGGAAVMMVRVGGNNTFLEWDEVRKLQAAGWGVINHSYWHKGRTWGDPPEILSKEEMQRDLYWSQTLIATETGNGRAAASFVYPNGYTGYKQVLPEFGIIVGTRVGGSGGVELDNAKTDYLETPRAYLDEGNWAHWGKSDPMADFPTDGPKVGQAVIDFTHGMDPKLDSVNYKRWVQRLDKIAGEYGQKGKDNLWSAPTGDIYAYASAKKAAKVEVTGKELRVAIPGNTPGSALTLKLSGIPAGAQLPIPEGGVVYRKGEDVYLTTPVIGLPGAAQPNPKVKVIYDGPIKNLNFEKPMKVAGVRVHQGGTASESLSFAIDLATPDGKVEHLVRPEQAKLGSGWGVWLLFNAVPDRPAISAKSLTISPDRSLQKMQVWVVEE